MKTPKPSAYVIAFASGPKQYGPFKTGAAAIAWAEKNLTSELSWVIKPLSNPF